MENKIKRFLSLALAIMMVISLVPVTPASAATISGGTVLYLQPNSNWTQSNARFAAYFFGSSNAWASMTDSDSDGVYEVTAPSGSWTNVIFCRMIPSNNTNDWSNKWNQTGDLVYDGTNNLCTINAGQWDCGTNVTWSVYTAPTTPVVHTYTVAGVAALCGTDWDVSNTDNDMTEIADGQYQKVYTGVSAGSYLFKVVRDYSWDSASWPASNYELTVEGNNSTVTITFDRAKGTVTAKVDPCQHPNLVTSEQAAGCTTDGFKKESCQDCGYSNEVVFSAGHSYVNGGETCDNCDEPNPDYGINTFEELKAALEAGESVELSGDITFTADLLLKTEAVLDLAGHNLITGIYLFGADKAGTLTILDSAELDGKVTATAGGIMNRGILNIQGGTFEANKAGYAIRQNENKNAKTVITGGTFNGNFKKDSGELSITGGTFSGDVSDYVADGYQQNTDGSVGEVPVTTYVAEIGEQGYETLQAALSAVQTNGTIKLLADIELNLTAKLNVGKYRSVDNVTIDGDGHTITVASTTATEIFSDMGPAGYNVKNLTIVGGESLRSGVTAFNFIGAATMENVTISGAFENGAKASASTLNVTGCTFSNTGVAISKLLTTPIVVTGSTFNSTIVLGGYNEFIGNVVNSTVTISSDKVTFEKNNITANGCVESTVAVNVSGNYWGGEAPSANQLKNNADGVEVILDNYYTDIAMSNLKDINTLPEILEVVLSNGETYTFTANTLNKLNEVLGSETEESATITLLADATLPDGIQVAAQGAFEGDTYVTTPKTISVNLNGFTLTGFIQVNKGVTATIKNGTVNNPSALMPAIDVAGEATLEGLNVASVSPAIQVDGKATVVSGTYTSTANSNPAKVTGELAITGGTFSGDVSDYVADGYQQNTDGSVGEVPATAIEVATLDELVAALADTSSTLPIVVTETIVIPAGQTVTLDLNGKTVSMVHNEYPGKNHEMILVKGNLTVKGTGKLSYQYTGTSLGTTYAANVITVDAGGNLVVQGGTIENLTYDSAVIAYAIDGRTNGGTANTTVTIEGGSISSLRQAIRMFANAQNGTATLKISGGDITGRVIMQNANAMANKAALEITGGTITANAYKTEALYVGGSTGATMDLDANISGGTFNGEILSSVSDKYITGGTFSDNVSDILADGYQQNADGSVGEMPVTTYVAKIGDQGYETLDAAIAALQSASGDVTVEIYGKAEIGGIGLNNPNITSLRFVGKTEDAEICIDGQAYVNVRSTTYPITYEDLILSHTNGGYGIDGRLQEYFSTYNGGDVTYIDCSFPNGVCALGSTNGTTVTFDSCEFNNTTSGQYSLWVDGNGTNVVVNGGSFTGVRGAKIYAENGAAFSTLSISNAIFADSITEKHAIVMTRGESIVLSGNTFNNAKGVVEVDDDCASEIAGKSVTIDGTAYEVDSASLSLVLPSTPVEEPTATATAIAKDGTETFAVNFKMNELSDAQLAKYGSWNVDLVLTMTEAVALDGTNAARSNVAIKYAPLTVADWRPLPSDEISLEAGEAWGVVNYMGRELPLNGFYAVPTGVDYAVTLLESVLTANPDIQATVSLQLTNPENEKETIELASYTYGKPDLPTAVASKTEVEGLTFSMNFQAGEATKEQLDYYGKWYADFELTVNQDMTLNADMENSENSDGYLSGQYDANNEYYNGQWYNMPLTDTELKANETVKIMDYAADVLDEPGLRYTYEEVYNDVKDFDCGMYINPEFIQNMTEDLVITLELRIYNPDPASDESYTIGNTYTFIIPKLPTATAKTTDVKDLTFSMNFQADAATQAQLDYYGNWYADFELTTNQDMVLNADMENSENSDGYLSGQYDANNEYYDGQWYNAPLTDELLKANETVKIMDYAAKIMDEPGLRYTYKEVYNDVKDFDCGMFIRPEFIKNMTEDLVITLKLRIYNPAPGSNESYTIGDTYTFVLPMLPTATVKDTGGENDLTFSMNFEADEASEAKLAYYGNWYADFELTANQDMTLNAAEAETSDGYLSGQYDANNEYYNGQWFNVPLNDVELKANETVKIMDYVAKILNQPGLRYTYKEVYEDVKSFNCGMFINPEFIKNLEEDLVITLELKLYNPDDPTEVYTIGETYTFTIEKEEESIFGTGIKHSVLYKDKVKIQWHFPINTEGLNITKSGAMIWEVSEFEAEMDAFNAAKEAKTAYTSEAVYAAEFNSTLQDDLYVVPNEGQKPREMHLEYYAVPYVVVDGEYIYGEPDRYSIWQYADDILSKSTKDLSKSAVEAMMRYAKFTQIYLAELNEVEAYTEPFDAVLTKHGLSTEAVWSEADKSLLVATPEIEQPAFSENVTTWFGGSVLMKDQTLLCYILNGKAEGLEILYWSEGAYAAANGNPVKGTETGVLSTVEYSSTKDQGTLRYKSVRHSDEIYYARVYDSATGEYGQVRVDGITALLSRIYNAYESNAAKVNNLNFAKAYLKYIEKATAYLDVYNPVK